MFDHVKSNILYAYSRLSPLRFSGFNPCTGAEAWDVVRIRLMSQAAAKAAAGGIDIVGGKAWSRRTYNETSWAVPRPYVGVGMDIYYYPSHDLDDLAYIAVHEMGHVLGFFHEEERASYWPYAGTASESTRGGVGTAIDRNLNNTSDSTEGPCAAQTVPSTAFWGTRYLFGAYDVDSVMSYCGTYDGRDGRDGRARTPRLSLQDMATTQRLFGVHAAGSFSNWEGYCAAVVSDSSTSYQYLVNCGVLSPDVGSLSLSNGVARTIGDQAGHCWGAASTNWGTAIQSVTTCASPGALTFRFEGELMGLGDILVGPATPVLGRPVFRLSPEHTIAGLYQVAGTKFVVRGDAKIYVGSTTSGTCLGITSSNLVGPVACGSSGTNWEWLADGTTRQIGTNLCLTYGGQTYAQFESGTALATNAYLVAATCDSTRMQSFRLRGNLVNDQSGLCVGSDVSGFPGTMVPYTNPVITLSTCYDDNYYYRPRS